MRYMSKSIITFLLDIPWASVSKFGLGLLLSEDMMIIGQTGWLVLRTVTGGDGSTVGLSSKLFQSWKRFDF